MNAIMIIDLLNTSVHIAKIKHGFLKYHPSQIKLAFLSFHEVVVACIPYITIQMVRQSTIMIANRPKIITIFSTITIIAQPYKIPPTFAPPIPSPTLFKVRIFKLKHGGLLNKLTAPLMPLGPNALSLKSNSVKLAFDAITPFPRCSLNRHQYSNTIC